MIVKKRKKWKNTINKHRTYPLKYFYPEAVDDVKAIVKEAEFYQCKVRAVGSGHSFSDVAITNDYLIDLSKMNRFLLLRSDHLKKHVKNKKLVHVHAGITVHDLNKGLDQQNLSIVNMGGIDHQTLGGAISTGTHGSGVDLLDMSGMVRSIEIVSYNGTYFKLEPKAGITDPKRYKGDAELLQDDNTFYAALVSLGTFGITTAYTLEVEAEYWLQESKTLDTWSNVKTQIREGSFFEGYRNVMVRINPYEIDNDHMCIVVRHNKINKPEHLTFADKTRNLVSTIVGSIAIVPYISKLLFNIFPKLLPKFLNSSLKGLKDKKYANTAHKVLYQGLAQLKEHGFDAEFAFDARNNKYLDVVDDVFEVTEKTTELSNLYATSPIGLRWVKGTKAMLAANYGRLTCYVDCSCLTGVKGSNQLLDRWQQLMWNAGGRPHWGKTSDILDGQIETLKKRYPKLDTWHQQMNKYNINGTFDNEYTRRVGLTTNRDKYMRI